MPYPTTEAGLDSGARGSGLWGYNVFSFTRTVDTHVAKLRKKVEDDPAHPKLIVTIHGLGYRYLG